MNTNQLMTKTEFTPAPWQQGKNDEWERHKFIYAESGIIVNCDPRFSNATEEERVANARLVAAAPNLLVNLLETHSALCFTENYLGSERYNQNKQVIKDALGHDNF